MIPVYTSEIEAGLELDIKASASFDILADVTTFTPSDSDKERVFKVIAERAEAEANPNQFDLYYLQSVLASVGWNKNDDVFDKREIWRARSTALDKPFNYMHHEDDIIGHITSSVVVGEDGIIADDTEEDDLPDCFDIVVGSVLYKHWTNEDRQARMDKIIAQIADNLWKVSMECLFNNFDYAVITPDGDHKTIKRTQASSFLTKHLRAYGGTGEHDGYKVGRLLRDFAFSGKGLVEKPANPRSDIVTYSNREEVSAFAASAAIDISETSIEEDNNKMADTISYTQEQYEFLQTQLDEVKASLVKKDTEIEDLTKQLAEATEQKTQANEAGKTAVEEAVAQKDTEIDDLKKKLEESNAAKDELQGKLDAIDAEKAQAARLAKVLERDVSDDKAQVLVEQFAELSDEQFDAVVDALPEKKAEAEETETKVKETEAEEEGEATAEETQSVEDAEVDKEEAQAGDAHEEDDEPVYQAAASWLATGFSSTAGIKKD